MHKGRTMKGYKKSKRHGGKKCKMSMKSKKYINKNGNNKNFIKTCRNIMEMKRTLSRMRYMQ